MRRSSDPTRDEPFACRLRTPFAVLGLRTSANALVGIEFLPKTTRESGPADAVAERAARQLERWLEDPAFVFDLTLRPDGTPFQQRAWQAMRDIPLGTVATYGELAAKLGSAARAVGGACGANPIPVIIPCHRVVASGHRMGGFMGHVDGDPIAIKRWLLAHEGVELA